MLPRLRPLVLALVCTACADGKGDTDATGSTTGASTGAGTAELSASASSANPTDPPGTTTTTTTDSSAGASGDASGDASGEPEGALFCQERCRADADCTATGTNIGFTCQGGRCVGDSSDCTDSDECRVIYSGWVTLCDAQQDCPGQVCIAIGGGEGRCATVPSDLLMCELLEQSEVTMPAIEGDGDLVVCANTSYTCKDAICQNPCEDDLSCSSMPGHPRCDVDTGVCGCKTDVQCQTSGVPGWTRCNAGTCGCGVDTDCVGSFNADVCQDGFCGCSSITACTVQTFDGTTPVCEPL